MNGSFQRISNNPLQPSARLANRARRMRAKLNWSPVTDSNRSLPGESRHVLPIDEREMKMDPREGIDPYINLFQRQVAQPRATAEYNCVLILAPAFGIEPKSPPDKVAFYYATSRLLLSHLYFATTIELHGYKL